ncbi:MAG TPA: amino acid permease [Gemmatimonadales bacterium]|nr:amino acid permease [Gemmatimonadales bacterium]
MSDLKQAGLQRVIGVRGLAAAIFNITVGAGVFVLPAHAAGQLGAAAPLGYIICAVAMALVALCFAEAGSRVPRSGGPYAYVEAAFGPYIGYLCGVLLWLGITLAMGAVTTVFADALGTLLPNLAGFGWRVVILILLIGSLSVVNVRGAALGSRLSVVSIVAKLLPLLAFVVLGLPHVSSANLAIESMPPLKEVGATGLLLMFAFFGMESALQVSGEVAEPQRTVPRAIALGLFGIAVLYISVQLVAQGVLGSTLAAPETASAPLAAAARQFAGTAGAQLILIGMIVSTFGFMAASMLSTPRTLYALAANGFLPRPIDAVHPRYHTPHVAIAVQAVVVCAIALTATYVKLAIMAGVAVLLVYIACCVAAARLRRLDVGADGNPFRMPAGGVVPWVAAGLLVFLIATATLEAWLWTGGVVALASLGYLARRRANDSSTLPAGFTR